MIIVISSSFSRISESYSTRTDSILYFIILCYFSNFSFSFLSFLSVSLTCFSCVFDSRRHVRSLVALLALSLSLSPLPPGSIVPSNPAFFFSLSLAYFNLIMIFVYVDVAVVRFGIALYSFFFVFIINIIIRVGICVATRARKNLNGVSCTRAYTYTIIGQCDFYSFACFRS